MSHVLGIRLDSGTPTRWPASRTSSSRLSLNFDGNVYILESGAVTVNGPIEPYTAGQRFRIRITDNHNGTASILYTRLDGPCHARDDLQ